VEFITARGSEMAEEPSEQPSATMLVGVGRVGDSASEVSQMRGRVAAAQATLTAYLRDIGRATNREMVDFLDSDRELFERVREALILDGVASDMKGVGLIYLSRLADADERPLRPTALGPPTRALRVFLSYPHDRHAPLAERLRQDLEQRGHQVWFDRTRLCPGDDWETAIENGLDWVAEDPEGGVVILLMTPHSVRRPDGYCLNELTLAVLRRIRIVPAMLVTVEPPLSITRMQWLDLRDCVPLGEREACYERKLPILLSALESNALDFEGGQARLLRVLGPIDYEHDVECHLPRFTGRKWLFRRIDEWLSDPDGSPVFWITGGPGSGKSAIAAWLSARRREVAAYHFCRFTDRLKADPAQAVRSIAWQLSTQLPDYFQRLVGIPNLEEACRKGDAATLFDLLIVQPLHNLSQPDRMIVVVIDALDEATHLGRSEFAQFLADETERLPDWMRLIVTSRPEIEVTQHLQGLEPVVLMADCPENTSDIAEYIRTHIAPHVAGSALSSTTLATLTQASEQNWLYIGWIRRELLARRLSLSKPEEFPKGLGAVYCQFFRRRIPDSSEYKKRCRPFLELLAAVCEPPRPDDLARILGWSRYELHDVLHTFGSLLDVDQYIRVFHRSAMDWLSDPARAGNYFVDSMAGHRALADFGWSELGRGVEAMSDYMKRWLPTHLDATGRNEELANCVTDAEFVRDAFVDGRHLELSCFWGDAGSPEFARRCEVSYDRYVQKGESAEQLYRTAHGLGELFQACGVYASAITYFEQALTIAMDHGNADEIGFSHLNIGWCCRHTEEFQRAARHVEAAIERFQASGNKGREGRAQSIKGICLWHMQHDLAALKALDRARALCAEVHDDRGEAEALNHIGIVRRGLGQYETALQCLHRAETFYAKIKDLRGLGKCCNSLGTAYWWSNQYSKALDYYQKADDYNGRTNQPYVAGLTANNLGYLYLEKAQYQKAREAFARARAIRQALGTKGYEVMDISGLALAFHHLGDAGTARRLSQEAQEALQTVPSIEDQVRAYYNHYLICRDGSPAEVESATLALSTAKKLVADRIGRIDDQQVRSDFVMHVPLIRELQI
jgi:tetratricopeptide (TPR) repeat protein